MSNSLKTYTWRVLFKQNGEFHTVKIATDFTKAEIIDRFALFANTHKLRGLMDALTLYPEPLVHKLGMHQGAEEIAFNAIQNMRDYEPKRSTKVEFFEFDRSDRSDRGNDHNADFIWDGSMMYARGNSTSDCPGWIKVTDYPTEYAITEYKKKQFNDLINQCWQGKWFRKGDDYFKVLRELLEYSDYPVTAVGFDEVNESLLDELDAILREEPVWVESELYSYKDYDDWDEHEYRLTIVRLPEWLKG